MRSGAALRELLTELAFVLLPRGMTPKRFSELTRSAFVEAAAGISKLRNGRVNYSRVAAQTGLTRADVKRVLKSDVFDSVRHDHTALERVIDGWRTDREFSTRPGHPKSLQIAGPKSSFARLVKKYGGDVPQRAVLDELRRIRAVSDNGGSIKLRLAHLRRRHNFAFLSPVIPALVDALRIAAKRSNSTSSPSIHRLNLPVETEVDLTIVRDRCVSGAQSLLDGLSHSLGTQVTIPKRGRAPRYSFTITILLAENRAIRNLKRSATTRTVSI
jgi:Family of unknown function (DUF6502)